MASMHNPPHPADTLSPRCPQPLRLSITAAATQLGVSRKTLSEIVNARASVTPEMALRLELAFGKSAASWLGQQAAYDLWALNARRATLGVQALYPPKAVPA